MADIPNIIINAKQLRGVTPHQKDFFDDEDAKVWDNHFKNALYTTCFIGEEEICVINNFDTSHQSKIAIYILDELDIEYGTTI